MKTALFSSPTSKSIYPSLQQNNSSTNQQLKDQFKRKRNKVHVEETYEIRSVKENVEQRDLDQLMNNYQRKYGRLEEEQVRSSVGGVKDGRGNNARVSMAGRNARSSLNVNQYVISQTPKKQAKKQISIYQQKQRSCQPPIFQTQLKSLIKIIYQKQKQIQKYKYYSNEQRIKRQKEQNQRKIKQENNQEVQSCKMISNLSQELIQTTSKVGQLQEKLMELHGIVEFLIRERDQLILKNNQLQQQIRKNYKLQQKKAINRTINNQTQTQTNISSLQLKLQQLNFQLVQLTSSTNELTTKNSKLSNQNILLSAQLAKLQQQLNKKSFQLKQILLKAENQTKSKKDLSIEIQTNIKEYRDRIFQLEKLNQIANEQIIRCRNLVEERQIDNFNLKTYNNKLNTKIQQLSQQIVNKMQNIQSLTNQIQERKCKFIRVQEQLQNQRLSVIQKQRLLQAKHHILVQKQSQLKQKQSQLKQKQLELIQKQAQVTQKQRQQPHHSLLSLPTISNLSCIDLLNSSFQQKLHQIHQQPHPTQQSPSFVEYQANLLNQLERQCQQPTEIFLQRPVDNTKGVELEEVRQSLKMTKDVNFQLFQEINKMEKLVDVYKLSLKQFFSQFNNVKTGKGNDQIIKIHKVRNQLDKMEKLINSNFR